MSVIVKNLSLPESCSQCRFLAYDDYATGHEFECLALREFMYEEDLPEGRRSDCPIFDENTETLQSIVLNDRYGNVAEYAKVIRRKDCKNNPSTLIGWIECPMTGAGTRQPNDFCSYAKPKEK